VVFQGEDKVLERDILKAKQKTYIQTEREFSARERRQIFRFSSGNGTATLFAVDDDKVFFITSAYFQITTTAISGAQCSIHTGTSATTETTLIRIQTQIPPAGTESIYTIKMDFPMPIKVNSNDSVTSAIPTNVLGVAMIHGWEESKVIS